MCPASGWSQNPVSQSELVICFAQPQPEEELSDILWYIEMIWKRPLRWFTEWNICYILRTGSAAMSGE